MLEIRPLTVAFVLGQRLTFSAIDGKLRETMPDQALKIAENWFDSESNRGFITASYLETVDKPIILRNQDALSPFHRIAVDKDGSELLISARTGEVLHASTVDRAFFWALRGFLDTNPGKIFSQANPSKHGVKSLSALKILKFVNPWLPGIGIYRNFQEINFLEIF